MPELPEVETIACNLRPLLSGRTILAASLLWPRTLAEPSPEQFQQAIPGQQIQTVTRRAKFLNFQLSTSNLIVHLRMSGDLSIEPADAPLARHCRLALALDDGSRLAFIDTRKFGRVWLTADPGGIFSKLGPEPLDPGFTPQTLHAALAGRRRLLKPLLLDQTFLAGLGNIYADEALHQARLHPQAIAAAVSQSQTAALWQAIRDVLNEGIQRNGASIDWVYRGGDFQNHFRVYQRTGQPCFNCATPILRVIIGQRSAHFCPNCQKL